MEGYKWGRSLATSHSSPSVLSSKKGNTPIGEPSPGQDLKKHIVVNVEKSGTAQKRPYLIFENGIDYTPKNLNDPQFPNVSEKQVSGMPSAKPYLSRFQDSSSKGSLSSRYSIRRSIRTSIAPSLLSAGHISFGEMSWMTEVILSESESDQDIQLSDKAPSMFRRREDPPPKSLPIETDFKIKLTETDTMFMMELPSRANVLESDEGKVILELNSAYDKGLQTTKTISHTATQTVRVVNKDQHLLVPCNSRVNASAYATVWDIYDSYNDMLLKSLHSLFVGDATNVIVPTNETEEEYNNEKFEFCGEMFDSRFLNTLMLMERLLEEKCFNKEQLLYQGYFVQDPLSTHVKFSYSLRHLWTFTSECTRKRNVTCMCWSSKKNNVLAVGYGKFKYTDQCNGLVCIWNVKNPQQPERCYEFEDPVTFLTFSPTRYQILAVSFYSGLVLLIDIISRTQLIKASNRHYPLYYPVWQAQWYPYEDRSTGQLLITSDKDGRIFRYRKTEFFLSEKIMSMGRPHGNIQGVEQPKKCHARKTLTCRHPSAIVLVLHPTEPLIYLVGTAEGCVYICSVNHRHDHIDVFQAHAGAVYNIQFNPFCNKIFLTCGADWCIRIWAESVFEPLMTLESSMVAVQDAIWSPLHSTIIVSVTGNRIEIWDIRRRTAAPKSSTVSPSSSQITFIKFSPNKFNLSVGDVEGNVHVIALTEMPFSSNFQEEVLVHAVENVLICRPDIIEKLRRLGHPFVQEQSSHLSKMYRKLGSIQKNI